MCKCQFLNHPLIFLPSTLGSRPVPPPGVPFLSRGVNCLYRVDANVAPLWPGSRKSQNDPSGAWARIFAVFLCQFACRPSDASRNRCKQPYVNPRPDAGLCEIRGGHANRHPDEPLAFALIFAAVLVRLGPGSFRAEILARANLDSGSKTNQCPRGSAFFAALVNSWSIFPPACVRFRHVAGRRNVFGRPEGHYVDV